MIESKARLAVSKQEITTREVKEKEPASSRPLPTEQKQSRFMFRA